MHYYDFLSCLPFDTDNPDLVGSSSRRIPTRISRDDDIATDEPSPVLCISHRPLDAWRRHFQYVLPAAEILLVQLCLDRARCSRAIFNRNSLTVLSLDSNV